MWLGSTKARDPSLLNRQSLYFVRGRVKGEHQFGDILALRYITSGGRIEICWPCRLVEDRDDLVALFIAANSRTEPSPRRLRPRSGADDGVRCQPTSTYGAMTRCALMLPARSPSVSLLWGVEDGRRRLLKYFVNMEEPFRCT
jgi:hypothetical protein